MEVKITYFSRRTREERTGESWRPVVEDLRAHEGVSNTFTRRSAVVANIRGFSDPSTATCSIVALKMFESDGSVSTRVAFSGAETRSVAYRSSRDRHTLTWLLPSRLLGLMAEFFELCRHVKRPLLIQ
jgi:hypothetical protein